MVDAAWVLAMMLRLQPEAPWRSTYERTSQAIATGAERSPVFAGEDGPARTAALLVSVAWFESRFQPDARGDRPTLPDGLKGGARSLCLLQIGASNLKGLGLTREEILGDVDACVSAGLRMMRASFRACRAAPLEERLAHYAGGGYACPLDNADAVRKSRHRVRKALWLFRVTR